MKRRIFTVFGVLTTLTVAAVADEARTIPAWILGTYGSPQSFWDKGGHLGEYGVNAAFIRSQELNEEVVERVRSEGALVFAEFPTLNGRFGNYIDQHPDAHPIDDSGNPAPPATWFMGVCPTHEGFRQFRMDALRDLLTRLDLDGVWMDYHHWHAQFEDPYPVFIKTCFNDSCISAFEAWAELEVQGETVPDKARWIFMNAAKPWEDWRVHVLVDWAREIREITKELRPHALVGNYQAAWKDEDLSGIRRRALGLDFTELQRYVDVYSPMIYHGRSGKSPDYIKEYVEYFSERHPISREPGVYPKMWPIVQAHDQPRIEPEELEYVLRSGLEGNSSGVMMFTIGSIAADPGKMEVMKRVYTEFGAKNEE